MPLTTPNPNELRNEFIKRCMSNSTMKSEYPDNDQRLAVCVSQWNDNKASYKFEKIKLK